MKFQTLWQPAVNRHSQYITIEKQTYLRISSRLSLALVLVRFIVTSYNTAADLFSFITFYLQASSLGLGSIELSTQTCLAIMKLCPSLSGALSARNNIIIILSL